ncbi:MAG TPA: hypothetical protein VFB39_12835 [Solirubrobacteraceae bacterium]|nr:hypothetical protein [Solirubrobacteraceae bacterium]
MVEPPIRLYGIPLSHPVGAVRGMLEYKGLAYFYIELLRAFIHRACGHWGFAGPPSPPSSSQTGVARRARSRSQGRSRRSLRGRPYIQPTLMLARPSRRPSAGEKACSNPYRDA